MTCHDHHSIKSTGKSLPWGVGPLVLMRAGDSAEDLVGMGVPAVRILQRMSALSRDLERWSAPSLCCTQRPSGLLSGRCTS
jgi:hypothetical protein